MSVTVEQGNITTGDQAVAKVEAQGLFAREANPGDLINIPSRTLPAARCPSPATYVVGFKDEQAARDFKPEDPADLPTADA